MRFQIAVTRRFSAAHQLRLYDGSLEEIHGHNWVVEVTVGAPKLDSIGVVMDFHELEAQLDRLISPFHNHHLNNTPPFDGLNPTTELIAQYVGDGLKLPQSVALVQVKVWETPDDAAVYVGGA